jgi:hypothetical protein
MRSVDAGRGSSINERIGWGRRKLTVMVAVALALGLPACGGGGGGTGPTPVTQAPAPVKRLITGGQGNFTLLSVRDAQAQGILFDSFRVELTLPAGTFEADVDWTFASSVIAVGLERSPCSFAQFYASQCADVASVGPPAPKPGRLIVNSLAAGNYVLFIANVSNNSESGNYQLYLTN